ncbi:hypothetical protein ACFW1M_25620 [Streptomyces inhibens]|uniref:Uncharacterized protein n=1 Tax=Streptomyces inhibens TaxID=2293571 RepID=A0A371Q8Q2_STRIH|nr:hypothetical protein [Streptomyces inhibens]REK91087.1 hypothetical protein DY245_06390 [Streptomyces inhibens]
MTSVLAVLDFLSPRYLLMALRLLPVVLVVILMAPAFLTWIFLPPARHDALLSVLQKLIDWTKVSRA